MWYSTRGVTVYFLFLGRVLDVRGCFRLRKGGEMEYKEEKRVTSYVVES